MSQPRIARRVSSAIDSAILGSPLLARVPSLWWIIASAALSWLLVMGVGGLVLMGFKALFG